MTSDVLDQFVQAALAHHRAGRVAEAEAIYRRVLEAAPMHGGALHLLGMLLHHNGRRAEGLDLLRRAITQEPLAAIYQLNFGSALAQEGRVQEALEATRRAIELAPADAQGHFNLGVLLDTLDCFEEAVTEYGQAITLRPDFAAAYNNLGKALHALGRFDEAEKAFRQSLDFRPADSKTLKNLGKALHDQGRLTEAAGQYRQVIALHPDDADALNSLGTVLAAARQLDEAIDTYRRALALQSDHTMAMTNLGNALKESGQLDEGIQWFRRALDAGGGARTGNCLMVAIHLHPDYDPKHIGAEHRHWEESFARPLAPAGNWFAKDRNPDRRLRIGYVASQFGDQIVGHCILPLLANHDHDAFEIVCYSDTRRTDQMTEKLKATADLWRDTATLSDERLSALIRQDRIDILVDLMMHMERNRLLVFARKPAPVQVTWIGYPSTTGLHTIDYRLSDRYLDPHSTGSGQAPSKDGGLCADQEFYSERTLLLPDSYWCYQPLEGLPPPNHLPAPHNGFITFGCLNSFVKVNEQVLRLWAAVLQHVGNSRLLMMAPPGRARKWVVRTLQSQGIDASRIGFADRQPRRKYMELYHQIDLGLDTIPYNGHTTMLDSLWMGVPIVSLTGATAVSRGGLSVLSNVGLPELCARTHEEFIETASALAGDVQRLVKLRSTLRQRMAHSPLTDAPRFARSIEAHYRTMWREWCDQRGTSRHAADHLAGPSAGRPKKTAFHIMLVEPADTPHAAGFHDLARLLELSLRTLGIPVSVDTNAARPKAVNLVLGYQYLAAPVEGYWIAFQLEQLRPENPRTARRLELLAGAPEVWDYDPSHIAFLREHGITTARHVPIGFHPGLQAISRRTPDIDVLHYGSITGRRHAVLTELGGRCRVQAVFGRYGASRDELIARSKIVLNVHAYEGSIFEQIRVSYLLNNGRCVVAEDSPYNPYRDMAVTVGYEQIVDRCMLLLSNDAERERLAGEGAREFEAMPMTEILARAIGDDERVA